MGLGVLGAIGPGLRALGLLTEAISIGANGITFYRAQRRRRSIPWRDVRDMKLGGKPRWGWALTISVTSTRWLVVIRCGGDQELAERVSCHAERLWRSHGDGRGHHS